MGVKTTVGQVALRGGSRQDQSSGILVDERSARLGQGRSRGNLYVVAELSGPEMGQDALVRDLTELARDTYYGRRGSVTASLQHAMRRVNDALLEENRNTLPGEQRAAGMSCVVLRRNDLFVAQVGPTAVYHAHDGEVDRYPRRSPWLDGLPPEEADAVSLGERRDVNVALFHATVSEGDIILLTGDLLPRLAAHHGTAWADLLDQDRVDTLIEALLAEGRGSDVSALVVRIGEEPAGPVADTGTSSVDVAGEAWAQATEGLAELHVGDRLRDTGRRVSTTVSTVAARVGAGIVALLNRMVPEAGAAPEAPPVEPPLPREGPRDGRLGDAVQKVLIAVAVLIPIVVTIVVITTLLQRDLAVQSELDGLWNQALAQWQEAQTTADADTARTYLTGAADALDELLTREPDYPGAADLRQSVRTRLDVINNVERINLIVELNDYPDNADLSRVVVQGEHIFVMDRRNGQVYHHRLDTQLGRALEPETRETVLVSRGDQVGSVLVGDLVDMTWMPTGPSRQKSGLVILESGGNLLEYDPTTRQLASLVVASTDLWQFPELVGSHSGRFYVLDPSANQLWRYAPTPEGYALPPDEWLQAPVDLTGVVDMAIGDSIFLLYANGDIVKLTTGQPDAFPLSGWDEPPSNPSSVFTRPPDQSKSVYVADRGKSRIVRADKEGAFQQQFRLADGQAAENGDALADVKSLFVDEIGGQAFVLSGQKLYLLALPLSE